MQNLIRKTIPCITFYEAQRLVLGRTRRVIVSDTDTTLTHMITMNYILFYQIIISIDVTVFMSYPCFIDNLHFNSVKKIIFILMLNKF
jgi:hypothetical protein